MILVLLQSFSFFKKSFAFASLLFILVLCYEIRWWPQYRNTFSGSCEHYYGYIHFPEEIKPSGYFPKCIEFIEKEHKMHLIGEKRKGQSLYSKL